MSLDIIFNESSVQLLEKYESRTDPQSIDRYIVKYLIELRDEQGSLKTIRNRGCILRKFSRFVQSEEVMTVSGIDKYHVRAYIHRLGKEEKTPSTINTERRLIRWFLLWCEDEMDVKLTFNPRLLKILKDKKEPDIDFEPLDYDTVYGVIAQMTVLQDRVMTAMLFECGLRSSELINLKVEDIEFDQVIVYGKGGKLRPVYIPVGLAMTIEAFCKINNRHEGYLFRPLTSTGNVKYSADVPRQRIKKWFDKHGIAFWLHLMRHSFAVNKVKAGMDLRTVQICLGHSSIMTTQRYLKFGDPYVKQQFKNFEKKGYAVSLT